ncbi:uncharacterized protein LOC128962443 [Oppia nitens]|uniref:uncharacterized protein LOC128962443 n=1 Tax=Oppia nitens TaxID=1686743 RepID=UPI0023DA2E28|nr:uncharacterized protein LOC128962443 [Oppia nitens]
MTFIPNDCTDRVSVEIDIVFKEQVINCTKYYVVYNNNSYYVEVDGITRDHLPIVNRDTQPKPVDSRFKRIMIGKNAIKEYKFVGPLYLYKIPTEKDKYKFIGFNQVWLGCPQPLCISPGFDGILSMNQFYGYPYHYSRSAKNNMIVLFRGNYFWYYDFSTDKPPTHPPLTDNAIRIDERFVDSRAMRYVLQNRQNHRSKPKDSQKYYLNDSMVVPTYIDSDDEFVCYEWQSKISKRLKR